MESVWYYARDGAQQGPVSFDDLKVAAASGQLRPDDLVWKEGTADWIPGKSVAGLFPSAAPTAPVASAGYGVAPPITPPAMPVPPTRPRVQSPRAPIHDSPLAAKGPPPTAKDIGELAKLFLQRTVNPNPATIAPTADEEQSLVQAGYDPVAHKYAVWRRAMLWVAVVPTALAAFFRIIYVIVMDKDGLSGFGATLFFVAALALVALPVTAALAALSYERLARSIQLVLFGGVVSIALPFLVAFTPSDLIVDLRGVRGPGPGLLLYMVLLPLVLSLVPALSRGCLRVKSFHPESLVPGWALVASTPLLVLLTLATFVVIYHVAGNALLLLALILIVGAPLLYLTKSKLLTRPVTDPQEVQALVKPQLMALIAFAFGILLLFIYMFTAKLGGIGEITILGWERDKSVARLWSASFNAMWLEYLGRSIFMTVLFADLLVRMSVIVWREDRAFAGTPASQNFDRSMSGLGSAIETKGVPPVV